MGTEESAAVLIEINARFCRRCGECVEACPQSGEREKPVLRGGRGKVAEVAFPENCIACLSCAATCRARAIRVNGVKRPPLAVEEPEVASKIKGLY
jgi:NAD-dependent dihydropyrimidine dehydrogenase PreA subunit